MRGLQVRERPATAIHSIGARSGNAHGWIGIPSSPTSVGDSVAPNQSSISHNYDLRQITNVALNLADIDEIYSFRIAWTAAGLRGWDKRTVAGHHRHSVRA
jgi:hypothetical protein